MKRTATHVASGVLFAASVVIACSSFGASDEPPSSPVLATDAGVDVANIGDAGFVAFSCDATFCRDFDRVTSPEQTWPAFEVTDKTGTIALFADPSAPSRPNAFASSIRGDSGAFAAARVSLQQSNLWTGAKTEKISIEAEVLVATTGEKDVAILAFEVGANDKASGSPDAADPTAACHDTVLLEAHASSATWDPTLRLTSLCAGVAEPPKPLDSFQIPVDRWVHLRLDVNARAADVDGRAPITVTLGLAGYAATTVFAKTVGFPRHLRIDFGVSGSSEDARARYDNIAVTY